MRHEGTSTALKQYVYIGALKDILGVAVQLGNETKRCSYTKKIPSSLN